MHKEALEKWPSLLDRWVGDYNPKILDVGSYNVNGCLRPLVEMRGWSYIGLDMVAGPNVDIISPLPYKFPFQDGLFDIVISSSTLEHVEKPWLWMPELARVLKPGGMLAVLTHTCWAYHAHPVDCWRFLPDGFRVLFDLCECLERYDIQMYCSTDIYGLAWRKNES